MAELASALRASDRDALQYDWPEGRGGLRAWVAERLSGRGVHLSPEDVLMTSGAQQALDIAARLTLQKEQRVRVPKACYPGALELFADVGVTFAMAGETAEVEYVMPVVSNPDGGSLNATERAALVAGEGLVLEDDAYAELRFDGSLPRPLLAEVPERVFYVGTLSKTLCPGLRLGWLVAPPQLLEAARGVKHRVDLQGNTLAQSIVEQFLTEQDYDDRLLRLRTLYAERADALMTSLRKRMPGLSFAEPQGGFSLWATSTEPWDDVELLRVAISAGTSFDPGRDFRPSGAKGPLAMRLAFASLSPRFIDVAVERLARAFETYARQARAARVSGA
jgi:2-aminoadipate transaminase